MAEEGPEIWCTITGTEFTVVCERISICSQERRPGKDDMNGDRKPGTDSNWGVHGLAAVVSLDEIRDARS